MPKQPVHATGATRSKRRASNVIQFPKKRKKCGRPNGPVDPFTALHRHMANPNHTAVFLARLIAEHYGGTISAAVVPALILLTWPRDEWPPLVAWFHDWRLGIAGPLRSWPNQEKAMRLLHKGRA